MAKNLPKDRILPFEKLLVAPMVAELRGYASQADRYTKIVPATMPGMPDFVHMLRQLIKRLLEDLIEKIRDRLTELIALAMTYLASKIIPVINEIIYYVNKLIRTLNESFSQIMKVLRPIFQALAITGLIYGITEVLLKVIPDAGTGMGAILVFTTPAKRVLNFINRIAEKTYFFLKKCCGYVLAACEKLLKYLSWFAWLQAVVGQLRMFEGFMKASAKNDFNMSANDWAASTTDTQPSSDDLNFVECNLPDGTTEQLTPEICLSRGGSFEGMDLLNQLNDLNTQISVMSDNIIIGGVCGTGSECEPLSYDECVPPCEWIEDPIVDCILPDGTTEQIPLSECLARGGQQAALDELNRLVSERDSIRSQLSGLGLSNFQFDSDAVTSLLNFNESVDVASVIENQGVHYGFYGVQTGDTQTINEGGPIENEDVVMNSDDDDDMGDDIGIFEYPEGGKIKKKK